MTQMRTHTCGQLRMEHVGQQVTIVGWMENVREVGSNFAFVVVRDFYGTTQVVVENEEMMRAVKGINKESTISVTGTVRERASKNPKLATGDIEPRDYIRIFWKDISVPWKRSINAMGPITTPSAIFLRRTNRLPDMQNGSGIRTGLSFTRNAAMNISAF